MSAQNQSISGSNQTGSSKQATLRTDVIVSAESDVQPELSVIMPTLNEEDGIVECIDRIKTAARELQIPTEILISDSSTDRTPELAAANDAIVVEPDEPGYGYAYRYAFRQARGEYIAIGDADTTYDFEELPKLFELVANGDADMVIGSRLEGEIKDGAMPPLHQHIGNPLLTKFLNVFYDAGVSDAHSGMRVISREALDDLNLQSTGMEFASEMIMEAGARDMMIKELPITYREREGEATLESFRDGWRHVRFMLLNAPGYLFSVPGLVLGMLGLVIMALAYAPVELAGVRLGGNSMIAGSLLTLVGYQVGSFGILAAVATDPIRRPSDRVTAWTTSHFRLEQGVIGGLLLASTGTAYALLMIGQWITSGYVQIPALMNVVLAFATIVLGVQTIFGSFFMSTIADC